MRLAFSVPLLLLIFTQAQSQFKNILLDPGSTTNKPHEPAIAVNPDDPKNIVAIAALNNVYYSQNGGLSWKRAEVNSPLGVGGNPVLITDFKGNFYYFHLPSEENIKSGKTLDQIIVQESGDEGETWSEGVSIEGFDPGKDRDNPRAIVDRKGNWYATWTQFDKYGSTDSTCQSVVLLSTSSNGKKWSKPIQVSQTPGTCEDVDHAATAGSPAVTSNGERVFIAWTNNSKIFFDRSFDGGKMWLSSDLPIAEQPGGVTFNIPGIDKSNGMPTLLCDNTKKGRMSGALYMVWADQRNGENDTDIWFIRSLNFGDNWNYPLRINNDTKGKHQFLPAMAVDSETGNLYILYYDRRAYDDSQTDVYLAYSTDYGLNFKNVKISETPFVPANDGVLGDYISISANNGIITPIWTRIDNGQTSIWTAVIKQEDLDKIK